MFDDSDSDSARPPKPQAAEAEGEWEGSSTNPDSESGGVEPGFGYGEGLTERAELAAQSELVEAAVREGGLRGRIFREIRSWLRDLVIAALICVALIVYVMQPFRVEKTSMEPLLADGDRILVSKISLLYEPIRRGDVVVLWNPRAPGESWIKRVIALPGEEVRIEDGVVYIDGAPLTEGYIPDLERNPPKNQFPSAQATWLALRHRGRMREFGLVLRNNPLDGDVDEVYLHVPEGYYFVLGDHRRFSMDSRDSALAPDESGPGLIPARYIYGKAIFRYWPLDSFGPIPAASFPAVDEIEEY